MEALVTGLLSRRGSRYAKTLALTTKRHTTCATCASQTWFARDSLTTYATEDATLPPRNGQGRIIRVVVKSSLTSLTSEFPILFFVALHDKSGRHETKAEFAESLESTLYCDETAQHRLVLAHSGLDLLEGILWHIEDSWFHHHWNRALSVFNLAIQ